MPRVVKIMIDDDGIKKTDSHVWHYVINIDAPRSLCGGEAFGIGESRAVFEEKKDAKITCPECIKMIKEFKSIKL